MQLTKKWDAYRHRRSAVLRIGNDQARGPSRYVRFRVTVNHSRSMAPQTELHLEVGRNRIWVFDMVALPKAWRE